MTDTPNGTHPTHATCQVAILNGQVQPSATPISYKVDHHPSGNIILRLDGPNGIFVAFMPPDFARGLADNLRTHPDHAIDSPAVPEPSLAVLEPGGVTHLFADQHNLALSTCCGLTWDNLHRRADGTVVDSVAIRWTAEPDACTCPHYQRVPIGTEPNPPTHEPANHR